MHRLRRISCAVYNHFNSETRAQAVSQTYHRQRHLWWSRCCQLRDRYGRPVVLVADTPLEFQAANASPVYQQPIQSFPTGYNAVSISDPVKALEDADADFGNSALSTIDDFLAPDAWLPDAFPITDFLSVTAPMEHAFPHPEDASEGGAIMPPVKHDIQQTHRREAESDRSASLLTSEDGPSIESIIGWDKLMETLRSFRARL